MLAVFSLDYAARDTAFFWVLISLGLTESRILPAALADNPPRTLLISFCTVQLRTLSPLTLWRLSLSLSLSLSATSGPDPGELPGFWDSMVFRHAPISRKGSGKQLQVSNSEKLILFIYFHDSSTSNGDHLILLIKTGNFHKERMLSQTTIITFLK